MPNDPEQNPSAIMRALFEEWTAPLAESIESMGGERPQVGFRTVEAGAEAAAADTFWWEQDLSSGPEARVWIGTPASAWLELGSQLLAAAGIEGADSTESKSTYLEILRQALSRLGQRLGGLLRKEVNCEDGRELTAQPACGEWYEMEIQFSNHAPLAGIRVGASQGLLDSLGVTESKASANAGQPAAGSTASGQEEPEAVGIARRSKTLDLLIDLELPISVSFGRAELPLRDVLKLATGSIVELDRTVSEPVDLIVNNCVIARGEVVVVEGNYGVRIDQIISRQDRMRTIRI